jgi:hypothetical protein
MQSWQRAWWMRLGGSPDCTTLTIRGDLRIGASRLGDVWTVLAITAQRKQFPAAKPRHEECLWGRSK